MKMMMTIVAVLNAVSLVRMKGVDRKAEASNSPSEGYINSPQIRMYI